MSETHMVNPKPCPFCGGEAVVRSIHAGEGLTETWVQCRYCFAQSDPVEAAYKEPRTAIASWNRRAQVFSSTDREKIRVLQEALEAAQKSLATVARLAGKPGGNLEDGTEIRGYANNRAVVARQSLDQVASQSERNP